MEMVTTSNKSEPLSAPAGLSQIEPLIRAKGERIFQSLPPDQKNLFNKDWWYGRIMDWSMKNENFKTQMFRFVDVLPYLSSSSEVARHLKEYFAEKGDDLPGIFNFGLGLGSLAPGLLAGGVKKNVEQMARMFITGETPEEALPKLKKGREQSLAFTADLLGEATLSEKEALEYQDRYLGLIRDLAKDAAHWKKLETIDTDEQGDIPKVNVSVKVTSLYSQINEAAWEESLEVVKARIRPIFYLAKEHGVFINLDMEQYAHKDFTLSVFRDLLAEPDFCNYPHFGVVIQAYLRDSLEDTNKLIEFAKVRRTPFTIRLVKGAYWDYETINARQKNWPIPVYLNKKESDANFEQCATALLKAYPHIRVAIGSHNVRSIASAMVTAEVLGLSPKAIEFQMLYGMAEPIKKAVVSQGYRVREYATIGELIPGMAYLVRRLLENTSNESFLRSKFAEDISTAVLLEDPAKNLVPSLPRDRSRHEFENESPLDFSKSEVRTRFFKALADVKKDFGKTYSPIVKGKELAGDKIFERYNPAKPTECVGRIKMATLKEADLAIEVALTSFDKWKNTSALDRAQIIDRLAELILRDRYELAALEVYEVGKTWAEADGDITEAIDFCRYYAQQMRRLSKPLRAGHAPGEMSLYSYQPRGVALVIAPWNFPLAILTGMVSAALVSGNSVIMKPAEQSPIIAHRLMRLCQEAGLPNEVLSYLPGFGEEIGAHLVGHKDVDIIAFTGSRSVGLSILKAAAEVKPGQKNIKRSIVEMGGKNAIIIDSDADLDEAVLGVVYSAFGFTGQKCSACSRAVVLESIYDRFLERLIEATKSLHILSPENPRSYLGPVVDKEAFTRIQKTIDDSRGQFRLAYQSDAPQEGYFIPPTIFADVDPNSSLAQEEIFGPVLAVIRAKDLAQALKIANSTAYALTGGLYSRSPANIEIVKRELEVGNLYINRGNTGALVDRHPFGGFKMSGVGSKTGGPDYLLQFLEPRVITENSMRRGFAPSEG